MGVNARALAHARRTCVSWYVTFAAVPLPEDSGTCPRKWAQTCGKWPWRPQSCAPAASAEAWSSARGSTCLPTSSSWRRTGWGWEGGDERQTRDVNVRIRDTPTTPLLYPLTEHECGNPQGLCKGRCTKSWPEFRRAQDPREGNAVPFHQAFADRGSGSFAAGGVQRAGQPVDHLALTGHNDTGVNVCSTSWGTTTKQYKLPSGSRIPVVEHRDAVWHLYLHQAWAWKHK